MSGRAKRTSKPTGRASGQGGRAARPSGTGRAAAARALGGVGHALFGTRERASRFAAALIVGACIGGWFLARGPLIEHASHARMDLVQAVEFAWPGGEGASWPPRIERDNLIRIVSGVVTPDPFDQTSLEDARRALLGTGWFKGADPVQVRRRPHGRIVVEGTWRVPAAIVIADGAKHLVGFDGAPIRRAVGSQYGEYGYYIWNPRAPAPPPGEPWADPAVHEAIGVLALLHREPFTAYGQVQGVDLTAYASRGIELVTDGGSKVVWGSPIGQERSPEEPPAEEKVGRMARVLQEYGRIDAGAARLDLTRSPPVIRRTAEH